MNDEFIILEGKDYKKLIEEGMKTLQVSEKDLVIEVLENKKSIFSSYFKLKLSKKDANINIDSIENSINQVLDVDAKSDYKYKQIEFIFGEDGVYIKINENVEFEDIVERVNKKDIKNANLDSATSAIINKIYDTPVRIAEKQEEKKLEANYQIKITKDLLQAFIYVTAPLGGEEMTEESINNFLRDNKIVFGIKKEEISNMVRNHIYEKDVLVAAGIPPIESKDAKLEYHFDTTNEKHFVIDSEGKVNLKELSLVKNVKKGQVLVTLTPEVDGTPGKNILGLDISVKAGKKIPLPRGKYVEISDDSLQLIAAIDGEVKLLDGKVNVFSIHEVKANVDNSTGNIHFSGKVLVNGNVLTGFEIEADGDVEVYGVVEGAKIVSRGSIILHRGINGMNRGELYCEKDLVSKFIENSKVEVKGNITSDAIMHSTIVCGKKLEATGRKGLLVGGTFKVCDDVKAKVIGSPMATITEIEVGINPDDRRRYDLLKSEIKQTQDNLEKTSQAVELLTKLNKKTDLAEDKKILLSKSIQLKMQLTGKLEQINKEMAELEITFEEVTKSKIRVSDVIYPGSRVVIGSSTMYIKDPLKYLTLYRANAEIKIGSYED